MRATRFPERAENVADRLSGFMAHLRLNGIAAGVQESETALRALGAVNSVEMSEVRLALKAICARDAARHARFDDLFDAYWLHGERVRDLARGEDSATQNRNLSSNLFDGGRGAAAAGTPDTTDESSEGEAEHGGAGRLVGSRMKNIERVDLRDLVTPEDVRRAELVAMRIARAIRDRRSRRRKAARRGAMFDLRRIMRASVPRGGEPLVLLRKRRPERPVHLVALLDVSGSMSVYARVFLAFLKGLVSADQRTDAYLFHTNLVSVSDVLRDGDTPRGVNRMTLLAEGFGGGTKIGASLKLFNEQYAAHRVNGRTVVLILSDGYDTDPPELVSGALARLRKRGCRIVWLNPLKGWKDYEPVARGMVAALPHVDLFAAANTLAGLAALESEFVNL